MAKVNESMISDLYDVLLSLESKEDCAILFEDLCTRKEVENMAQRLRAAKLLQQGDTYNTIIEKTGIATVTLSRVSTCVKYGQGYKKFVK